MRDDASHHGTMQLSLEIQVVNELTATAQKTQIFDPLDWAADKGIGTFHRSVITLFGNPHVRS